MKGKGHVPLGKAKLPAPGRTSTFLRAFSSGLPLFALLNPCTQRQEGMQRQLAHSTQTCACSSMLRGGTHSPCPSRKPAAPHLAGRPADEDTPHTPGAADGRVALPAGLAGRQHATHILLKGPGPCAAQPGRRMSRCTRGSTAAGLPMRCTAPQHLCPSLTTQPSTCTRMLGGWVVPTWVALRIGLQGLRKQVHSPLDLGMGPQRLEQAQAQAAAAAEQVTNLYTPAGLLLAAPRRLHAAAAAGAGGGHAAAGVAAARHPDAAAGLPILAAPGGFGGVVAAAGRMLAAAAAPCRCAARRCRLLLRRGRPLAAPAAAATIQQPAAGRMARQVSQAAQPLGPALQLLARGAVGEARHAAAAELKALVAQHELPCQRAQRQLRAGEGRQPRSSGRRTVGCSRQTGAACTAGHGAACRDTQQALQPLQLRTPPESRPQQQSPAT